MPDPTLVKQDGSNPVGANSYADVADADAYMNGRPYGGTEWAAKSAGDKARCLITATLMIDAMFAFSGYRTEPLQPLQWPRIYANNPDAPIYATRNALAGYSDNFFASNEIPIDLVRATCEQAIQLALSDLTSGAANAGLSEVEIFQAVRVKFSAFGENSPPIPSLVQQMLSRLGSYQSGGSGQVKLVRT